VATSVRANAEIGDQRLHYVEAGQGPLIVLLHGFPEFWYGWRLQIKPLAAAGFHVVAPDLRGYNLSSRPKDVKAYDSDQLTADIRGLIEERGATSALLVGHDWGGTVAWDLAMSHPEVVDRLAILNAAHPRNHYRFSVRESPKKAAAALRPISAPTLVIWGERDHYLGPELAEPEPDDVPNLDRVERLPDASHWVHHDEAERVNQLLIDFFAPAQRGGA
jgi:pimeloyl-ACP methyl ester carboxylesterase